MWSLLAKSESQIAQQPLFARSGPTPKCCSQKSVLELSHFWFYSYFAEVNDCPFSPIVNWGVKFSKTVSTLKICF